MALGPGIADSGFHVRFCVPGCICKIALEGPQHFKARWIVQSRWPGPGWTVTCRDSFSKHARHQSINRTLPNAPLKIKIFDFNVGTGNGKAIRPKSQRMAPGSIPKVFVEIQNSRHSQLQIFMVLHIWINGFGHKIQTGCNQNNPRPSWIALQIPPM